MPQDDEVYRVLPKADTVGMFQIRSKFLLVEGPLQNQDNVIHIKATRLTALSDFALDVRSHDFH